MAGNLEFQQANKNQPVCQPKVQKAKKGEMEEKGFPYITLRKVRESEHWEEMKADRVMRGEQERKRAERKQGRKCYY